MLPSLTPDQLVKPRRFELRMSFLFAALFMPVGIHMPYFPLWLEDQGFGAREIAMILSIPLFLRVVTAPLITAFADRAGDRTMVLVACAAATFVLSLGYFLPPSYGLLLAISLALAVGWSPQAPLADSVALSGVRRFGVDYSRMRIWGSVSFLFANLGGGLLLSATGTGAVPVIISAGLAGMLAAALLAPRLGPPRRPSPLSAAELQHAPSLLRPAFLLLVAGAGLVHSSHGFLYGFGAIYWKSLGIGEAAVGVLWAWGVVAEVCMFVVFRRVFGRVPPWVLLALAGLAAILRWTATPLIWSWGLGLPGFFVVQSLHAVSTGLILLGVQKMIAETVPDHRIGAAQGVAFFAAGFGMAAVTLAAGPLYDTLGANGFHVMSGVAAAGIALVAFGALQPQRAGSGG